MKRRFTLAAASFAWVALAWGCATETPTFPDPPKPQAGQPTTVELTANALTGANAGHATIATRVLDAYANPVKDAAVALSTSDGTVEPSTVVSDAGGRGTATLTAPAGSVKVTATLGSISMSTQVAIQPPQSAPPSPGPIPPTPNPMPNPTPNPDPNAPLTVSINVTAAPAGQPTSFGLATQGISSASWNFGDGATATTGNGATSHVYTNPGSYTVSVTVQDARGRTASASTNVTIPSAPTGPAPSYFVILSASPSTVIVGGSSMLTAAVTPENGAPPPTSYAWDCGQGTFTTTQTNSTTCTYPSVGTFSATVSVSSNSVIGSARTTIVVPTPSYAVTLSASPSTLTAGGTSTLSATATPTNGAPPATNYAWDCGNGTTATSTTPSTPCSYPAAGSFTANVTVTGGSAMGSATRGVTVNTIPLTVNISASTTSPSLLSGGSVIFTATVTSSVGVPATLQWQWDSTNDGTYEVTVPSAASPNAQTFSYGTVGTKTVKVRVFDPVSTSEAFGTFSVTVIP